MAAKKRGGEDRADDRADELANEMRRRVSARAERPDDEGLDEDDDERSPPPPRQGGGNRDEVVDLDEDDDEEEGEEEQRVSRRERRQERSRIREENETLRREMAEMRGRLEAVQQRPVVVQAPPTQNEPDEYERARRGIHERSRALSVRFQQASAKQGGMTEQERTQFEDEFDRLEEERQELIHRRVASRNARSQDPEQEAKRMLAMQLRMEFPALWKPENIRHFQWANAGYMRDVAEGVPESPELMRKHLRAAAERLDPTLRPRRPPPAPERKARYEGVSARGGAAATRDEGRRIITLSEADKKMARARYRGYPDKKAFALFAKNVLAKKRERA